MIQPLIFLAVILIAAGLATIALRRSRAKQRAIVRMFVAEEHIFGQSDPDMPREARSYLVRYRWVAALAALLVAGVMFFVLRLAFPYILAVSTIVLLLGLQFEAYLAATNSARIELQLAEAIDLMVGALGAGAGVTDALANATRATKEPLKTQFDEMIGRIRLGDDPRAVFRSLAERVPLETFLLFSSALLVQWETGGSLAPTLAGVGNTIRDRIEISRRIRSNSAQSEASTVAVMLLTYFIAVVVWRTNPSQMEHFLATIGGQWCVAGSMLLHAVGLLWMSYISRMRF